MGMRILSDPYRNAIKARRTEAEEKPILETSPEAAMRFFAMKPEIRDSLIDYASQLGIREKPRRNPPHLLANAEPEKPAASAESIVIAAIHNVLNHRNRMMGTPLEGQDMLDDTTLSILTKQAMQSIGCGKKPPSESIGR